MIPNDFLSESDPRRGVDLGGISPSEIVTKAKILTEVPHAAVVRAVSRVRETGILERLEQWRIEDGMDHSVGGRPIAIDDLSILTGLMILAGEEKPMLIKELRELFQFRITEESRALLGLPDAAVAFLGVLIEEKRWYNNAHNAFHRIVACMNPYPYDMRSAKNHVTIKRLVDNHDHALAAILKARLDEFTERFLLMTFNAQPRDIRRVSKILSVSFDQTYLQSPTVKAYSRKKLNARAANEAAMNDQATLNPGPVDIATGYYVSSGGERGDSAPGATDQFDPLTANKRAKKDPEMRVGYAANFAVRVDGEKPGSERFPYLVVAATLSTPNEGVSEEAVSMLRSAAKTGLTPGFADADKDYFANAIFGRLHEPVVALGFQPLTDYRKDRQYLFDAPGGALYINDGIFCPGTPKALRTISYDYLNGIIDYETSRLRLIERKAFALHQKEKADAKGRVPMMCPALGASPTVVCPIREMLANATKKARPEIDPDDIPAELDRICQQHSVSFAEAEIKRTSQGLDYGSDEWEKFHTHARNGIESVNSQVKKGSTNDLESSWRRRARGITVAQIFATFALVQHNLKKIATFLKDQFTAEAQILVRKGDRKPRARDNDWKNAYTGSVPDRVIPIIGSNLEQPPQTS